VGAAAGAAITTGDLAGAGVAVAASAVMLPQHCSLPDLQPASSKAASAKMNNPHDHGIERFTHFINS